MLELTSKMTPNITVIPSNIVTGLYIVVTGYSLSTIISTCICLIIIGVTYITPNLHTPTHLLVSNTCIHSLVFSTVATINTFFFYLDAKSTDWSCRVRGYLTYVSICLVVYSYVIQTISRLFWAVLYKYRYLLTMKSHFYLIFFQISFSFLFPLSSLITTNIIFRPFKLCFVSIQYKFHALYILSIVYIIPILIIIILYIIIYCHVRNSSLRVQRSLRHAKRDIELARNILILLSIFLFGGVPLAIYVILSSEIEILPTAFYLSALVTPGISVSIEKIATVILNEDIRKVVKQRWVACYSTCLLSSTRVEEFSLSHTTNRRMIHKINKVGPITYQSQPKEST